WANNEYSQHNEHDQRCFAERLCGYFTGLRQARTSSQGSLPAYIKAPTIKINH
ncbi:unnamed protein product, partial [Amoebophrya sp. A25]